MKNEAIEISLFKCDQCDKSFTRQTTLTEHVKSVHMKIKRHFCDFCSAGFWYSGALKRHLRVHSGERPFACNYCKDARFKDVGTLANHHKFCKVKKLEDSNSDQLPLDEPS